MFDKRLKIANVEKNLAKFIIDYRYDDCWKSMETPKKYFQDLLLDQGGIRVSFSGFSCLVTTSST